MLSISCLMSSDRSLIASRLSSLSRSSSLNAYGICLLPPRSFEDAICDLKLIIKELYSVLVNSNIKSSPSNRSRFRLTASFRRLVDQVQNYVFRYRLFRYPHTIHLSFRQWVGDFVSDTCYKVSRAATWATSKWSSGPLQRAAFGSRIAALSTFRS